MARKKKWIQEAIKNQVLLLNGAEGKATKVLLKSALRKVREVQTPPHAVGLI